MKTRTQCLLASVMVVTSLLSGLGAETSESKAASAFERMKQLQGEWQSKGEDGRIAHVKYDLTAGGSAVLERYWADGVPEMTTLYTLDGNRLLLTHYCIAKNQPRMQSDGLDAKGELHFNFLDISGLSKPDSGHMHNASMRFLDQDHFTTEWQYFEGGKPKFVERVEFTRVK